MCEREIVRERARVTEIVWERTLPKERESARHTHTKHLRKRVKSDSETEREGDRETQRVRER